MGNPIRGNEFKDYKDFLSPAWTTGTKGLGTIAQLKQMGNNFLKQVEVKINRIKERWTTGEWINNKTVIDKAKKDFSDLQKEGFVTKTDTDTEVLNDFTKLKNILTEIKEKFSSGTQKEEVKVLEEKCDILINGLTRIKEGRKAEKSASEQVAKDIRESAEKRKSKQPAAAAAAVPVTDAKRTTPDVQAPRSPKVAAAAAAPPPSPKAKLPEPTASRVDKGVDKDQELEEEAAGLKLSRLDTTQTGNVAEERRKVRAKDEEEGTSAFDAALQKKARESEQSEMRAADEEGKKAQAKQKTHLGATKGTATAGGARPPVTKESTTAAPAAAAAPPAARAPTAASAPVQPKKVLPARASASKNLVEKLEIARNELNDFIISLPIKDKKYMYGIAEKLNSENPELYKKDYIQLMTDALREDLKEKFPKGFPKEIETGLQQLAKPIFDAEEALKTYRKHMSSSRQAEGTATAGGAQAPATERGSPRRKLEFNLEESVYAEPSEIKGKRRTSVEERRLFEDSLKFKEIHKQVNLLVTNLKNIPLNKEVTSRLKPEMFQKNNIKENLKAIEALLRKAYTSKFESGENNLEFKQISDSLKRFNESIE